MAKVKLGDVVVRIKDKVDKDNTDLIYYVGGEHFDNGMLTVKNKGLIKGSTIGPAFSTKFKTGDVLLMSRNPHLRKAGMVDFDGICSDVSYIIRTKDETVLMQKFIPIIFQSDNFWNFAEKNKKGSTNFFLNWSDFERFEFDLPTISEQQKYSDLIWAMEDTIESYQKMIATSDDLVKIKFIEIISNVDFVELGDICKTISGGTPSTKHPEYYQGDIPWVSTVALGPNYIDGTVAKGYITDYAIEQSATHLIPAYSILVGTRVGVGKSSINIVPMCTNQDINALIDIDEKNYNKLFIKYTIDYYQYIMDSLTRGSTILGITTNNLKTIKIPKLKIEMQHKFAQFIEQIDHSKGKLTKSISNLQKAKTRLITDTLNSKEEN